MSVIVTQTIRTSLKATLDSIVTDEMKQRLEWEDCGFRVTNTTDSYIDDQELAGTGPAQPKAQGATMAVDSIQEGFSKRYNMTAFGQRMIFSEEAIRDRKYEKFTDATGNLMRALKLTQELKAASVFINAFSSSFVGGDLVSLCSASHPLVKGAGTYSNTMDTNLSFTETGVETMSIKMRKLPGPNGYVTNGYMLKKLVLPEEYRFRARRILKSEQQNDTNNNAINALKEDKITFATNVYFTSATNWWGISSAKNGLRFVWRDKPEFREENTNSNYTIEHTSYERFDVGWTDPRGVYGSSI